MSAIGCSSSPIRPNSRRSRSPRWRSRRNGCRVYNQYTFTIEGHADERGTREYNIALGARRAQTVRDYLASRGVQAAAHAHDLLRQGAPGRGVQRYFLLVAESSRGDGAQHQFLSASNTGEGDSRRLRAPAVFCNAPGFPFQTRDRNFGGGTARTATCGGACEAGALHNKPATSTRAIEGHAMRINRLASAQLAACAVATVLAAALCACGQENRYVAPPPPKVTVAIPVQQKVTRYLEATGYTAAINTTNLVARVSPRCRRRCRRKASPCRRSRPRSCRS